MWKAFLPLAAVSTLSSVTTRCQGSVSAPRAISTRLLQQETEISTIQYVYVAAGEAVESDQVDGLQLQVADNTQTDPSSTQSIEFQTDATHAAQYELFFAADSSAAAGSNSLALDFVYQVGPGGDGAQWSVDAYNFVDDGWVSAGTLSGAGDGTWTAQQMTLPVATPSSFFDPTTSEYFIRVFTSGSAQTLYLDFAAVTATIGAPSPVPAPTDEPEPSPPAVVGNVVYVEAITGESVDSTQSAGGPLNGLENPTDTADSSASITMAATTTGQAQYEVYFAAPSLSLDTTGFTVSVNVKVDASSSGAHWKIDLYNFGPDNTWNNIGDLSAATSTWSQLSFDVPAATPADYVEDPSSELLARLYTDGASTSESIFVDFMAISAGALTPTTCAEYSCPADLVLDPSGTCSSATCTDTECCTGEPTPTEVLVDLQPCILARAALEKDGEQDPEGYLFNEFYKGFWTASQNVQVPGSNELDLLVDTYHGKCNVIYVSIEPTDDQRGQLEAYSRTFQVRIVYFDAAGSADNSSVTNRLGIQQVFGDEALDGTGGRPFVKMYGSSGSTSTDSVVHSDLETSLEESNLFSRPVIQTGEGDVTAGQATIIAGYSNGQDFMAGTEGPSVAGVVWEGSDGLEEMHLFFTMAWFDMGSWAWAHFVSEWATKGIFQGERRFYLGAVVDDHFLDTNEWVYNPDLGNEGAPVRCSGSDLDTLASQQDQLNLQYNAQIVTEFAFNGAGILSKIGFTNPPELDDFDADIGLLPKGDKPDPPEGIVPQLKTTWLSTAVPEMIADNNASPWTERDDLLEATLSNIDKFYWGSHTLTHSARDNLGTSDCSIEDGGNAQIAVLTGLFDSMNYNWRSMVSPGITGLFNKNCLETAAANLMLCYPGDNTFDLSQDVSLVSSVSQFHSIMTEEETNGYAGAQIVPRFATYVYYNCITGECLVRENEWIRRNVCECENLNPDDPTGDCNSTEESCTGENGISSFDSIDEVFDTEARTTTRYILGGRRDKYMFHQANIIPASDLGDKSLLYVWYEQVLTQMNKFLNLGRFPIQTLKFDNLCQDFTQHEMLDGSGALVTATKDTVAGTITGMTLANPNGQAGTIPITIPAADASKITVGLTSYKEVDYGPDRTFYIATSSDEVPSELLKPHPSELAPVPAPLSDPEVQQADADQQAVIDSAQNELKAQEQVAADARDEVERTANEAGFTLENVGGG